MAPAARDTLSTANRAGAAAGVPSVDENEAVGTVMRAPKRASGGVAEAVSGAAVGDAQRAAPSGALNAPGEAPRGPGDALRGPGDALGGPGEALRGSDEALRGPTEALRGPVAALAGQLDALGDSLAALAAPAAPLLAGVGPLLDSLRPRLVPPTAGIGGLAPVATPPQLPAALALADLAGSPPGQGGLLAAQRSHGGSPGGALLSSFQFASAQPPAAEAGGRPESPSPRKAPAPAAGGAAATAYGSSLFAPFLALLVLAALAAPRLLRRLEGVPAFMRPTLFACALERPG